MFTEVLVLCLLH